MDYSKGQEVCITPGRVLYVNSASVWLASGSELLVSFDSGMTWKYRGALPSKGLYRILSTFKLGCRLGRAGFHHLCLTGKDSGIVIAHRHNFYLGSGEPALTERSPINGSRPLVLSHANGLIYYGEYRSNPERSPVHVWATDSLGKEWKKVWQFQGVRHIHGVYYDKTSDSIWVTTGDYEGEVGIWRTDDNFTSLRQVVGGTQQLRAVQLLFTSEYVYFGSDTPYEENHIYRMDKLGDKVEQLKDVEGSVFYGCTVGNNIFFSTVVEPSRVNKTRYAQVWGSDDGNNWKMVTRFRKDLWPMKFFQYGQIFFPAGPGDDKHLWITPWATEFSQKTIKIPIKSIF